MKFSTLFLPILVGASMTVACNRAFATGYVTLPSDPSLSQHQQIGDTSAKASAKASSSSSIGNTSAQGFGYGGQASSSVGNTKGGDSSLSDNSETKMKALALSFAPGAHTPSMPTTGARFPKITQSATGVGFGLFSRADAETNTDVDSLYAMREIKLAQCQYLSVKQIDDGITKKAMPEFVAASDDGYANLTPEECAKLKEPVVVTEKPATAPLAAVIAKPAKACANPKPYNVPCARPGGIRKDDGCCYYACAGSK